MRIDSLSQKLWQKQDSRCRQNHLHSQHLSAHPAGATPIAQRGATLIELIVFIVIISVAVAGIMAVLNISVRHSADPLIRKQMLAIAESLMEEVQLQPFTFCDPTKDIAKTAVNEAACGTDKPSEGPPGGITDRSLYNNVINYKDIVLGSPDDAGSQIPDMTNLADNASPKGYWATIQVAKDGTLGPAASKLAQDEVLRITVTVASAFSDETIVLEGYRTRWAPNLDL